MATKLIVILMLMIFAVMLCYLYSSKKKRVVVSKLYDVTNMQTKKTRANFFRVSFSEIL